MEKEKEKVIIGLNILLNQVLNMGTLEFFDIKEKKGKDDIESSAKGIF